MSSFESRLEEGTALLNSGRYPEAIQLFDALTSVSHTDQENADAFHQLGITFGKTGDLQSAGEALEEADWFAVCAENRAHHYRILRDMAWLEMIRFQRNPLYFLISLFWRRDYGPLKRAYALLVRSQTGLDRHNQLSESLVTYSYFARVDLLRLDYEGAAYRFRHIDTTLRSQSSINWTYRLNLLMWLIRAVPKKERAELASIIEELIGRTGQTSREVELKIILKFGDVGYRIVQWFPERLQKIGYKLVGPLLEK